MDLLVIINISYYRAKNRAKIKHWSFIYLFFENVLWVKSCCCRFLFFNKRYCSEVVFVLFYLLTIKCSIAFMKFGVNVRVLCTCTWMIMQNTQCISVIHVYCYMYLTLKWDIALLSRRYISIDDQVKVIISKPTDFCNFSVILNRSTCKCMYIHYTVVVLLFQLLKILVLVSETLRLSDIEARIYIITIFIRDRG